MFLENWVPSFQQAKTYGAEGLQKKRVEGEKYQKNQHKKPHQELREKGRNARPRPHRSTRRLKDRRAGWGRKGGLCGGCLVLGGGGE